MKRKTTVSRIYDLAIILIMFGVILITLYPFLYVASVSISKAYAVQTGQVKIFPVGFETTSYERVFSDIRIWISYANTVKYTVVGTFFNIAATGMMAYSLSRKSLTWRKQITLLVTFTMLFNGGMIPTYMVVNSLKLIDTIWVMFLPGLVSTWNLLVMRTFFEGVPESLAESAYLDGATEMQTLYYIYLPISIPIILTMSLFYAVGHWNSFFNALIYLKSAKKFPLQIILRDIVISGDIASESENLRAGANQIVPEGVKAATIIVAILPIVSVYPFIQKYFIQGTTIGAIKG